MPCARLSVSVLRLIFAVFLALPLQTASANATEEIPSFGAFESLAIYRPVGNTKGLLFLLSGEDGWDADAKKSAKVLAELNYLVAGIDTGKYLTKLRAVNEPCLDPARDFQMLCRDLAGRYHLPAQQAPIIMGYGAGAALVYAVLAQAPAEAFHAAISVNFCPRLPLQKPLCAGRALRTASDRQGTELLPSKQLQGGWFVFQPHASCPADVAAFVAEVNNAKFVSLPAGPPKETGQKMAPSQAVALLQWLDPAIPRQVQAASAINDLPLREVPATAAKDPRMAIMLSGDGGWAALDRGVTGELVRRGIATVGWDSLSYFWNAKTPDQAAHDLERVLRHYTAAWEKSDVYLIGYSFGADVLSFMASRLPADLRAKVKLIVFLGLGESTSFEFHLSDWIGGGNRGRTLPIRPEVEKLDWTKRLCIVGTKETDSGCAALAKDGVTVLKVPGDHHFDEDYVGLAQRIIDQIPP